MTPAMRPNCRSSGVATDDAIVSGLAPGRLALHLRWSGNPPAAAATPAAAEADQRRPSAIATSAAWSPTGRRMNGVEMFMDVRRSR